MLGVGPVLASLRAVLSRQALICACVRSGFFWNIKAAVPVMCGAAIDVPDSSTYGSVPNRVRADVIERPGAANVGAGRLSRVGPRLDEATRLPADVPFEL